MNEISLLTSQVSSGTKQTSTTVETLVNLSEDLGARSRRSAAGRRQDREADAQGRLGKAVNGDPGRRGRRRSRRSAGGPPRTDPRDECTARPAILLAFVDEARSYLPGIRDGLLAYLADENQTSEIQSAYRLTTPSRVRRRWSASTSSARSRAAPRTSSRSSRSSAARWRPIAAPRCWVSSTRSNSGCRHRRRAAANAGASPTRPTRWWRRFGDAFTFDGSPDDLGAEPLSFGNEGLEDAPPTRTSIPRCSRSSGSRPRSISARSARRWSCSIAPRRSPHAEGHPPQRAHPQGCRRGGRLPERHQARASHGGPPRCAL